MCCRIQRTGLPCNVAQPLSKNWHYLLNNEAIRDSWDLIYYWPQFCFLLHTLRSQEINHALFTCYFLITADSLLMCLEQSAIRATRQRITAQQGGNRRLFQLGSHYCERHWTGNLWAHVWCTRRHRQLCLRRPERLLPGLPKITPQLATFAVVNYILQHLFNYQLI